MKYLLTSFLAILLLNACTSALDFDQAKQLTIKPVFEGDILYFDLNKDNLTDSQDNLTNNQHLFRTVIKDTVDFAVFEDGRTRDSFVKAEITVAYKNTFERQFATSIYFIDDQKQEVEQALFTINPANDTEPEINGTEVFTFDVVNNPDFVNSRKIVIAVEISPDNLPIEDKKLHVQVKGTFYTNIVIE